MPVQWTISKPHRLVIAVARDELRLKDVENYLDGVAIADVLASGLRTADIKGDAASSISTSAMGDAIVAALQKGF